MDPPYYFHLPLLPGSTRKGRDFIERSSEVPWTFTVSCVKLFVIWSRVPGRDRDSVILAIQSYGLSQNMENERSCLLLNYNILPFKYIETVNFRLFNIRSVKMTLQK